MTDAPRKYEALAATYDRRWQRYHAETFSRVARSLREAHPSIILDVPCGTGELLRWLLPHAPQARIVGVDGSAAMLNVARRKWAAEPRVAFQHALADSLPFGENTFDWVFCCSSLHYFKQPGRVLGECSRVLKPTGRLLLLDWCRNPWHCRVINWWKVGHDPTYVRMYTTQELERLLRDTGWSVSHMERFRVSWIRGLRLWEMMEALATPANKIPRPWAGYFSTATSCARTCL